MCSPCTTALPCTSLHCAALHCTRGGRVHKPERTEGETGDLEANPNTEPEHEVAAEANPDTEPEHEVAEEADTNTEPEHEVAAEAGMVLADH